MHAPLPATKPPLVCKSIAASPAILVLQLSLPLSKCPSVFNFKTRREF